MKNLLKEAFALAAGFTAMCAVISTCNKIGGNQRQDAVDAGVINKIENVAVDKGYGYEIYGEGYKTAWLGMSVTGSKGHAYKQKDIQAGDAYMQRDMKEGFAHDSASSGLEGVLVLLTNKDETKGLLKTLHHGENGIEYLTKGSIRPEYRDSIKIFKPKL